MELDNQLIRCVFCDSNSIDIYSKDTICNHCGHEFASFEGIIFLGSYSSGDTLGLLEITSKVFLTPNPAGTRRNIENSEEKLSQEFQKTYIEQQQSISDKKAIPGSKEMAQSVRLREWASFEILSEEFDFKDKLCLDLGAGLGFDTLRLVKRGAKVVCVDYNPVSLKSGSMVVPEAQWLGGNSECLPFVSETFDYSVANAALHHMSKLNESVKEMCRVTKPGGYIFLISDPFTSNTSNKSELEIKELQVFDNHPMVMNGVNEGLIPINQYLETIQNLDSKAKILTMKIHGKLISGNSPTYWPLNSKTRKYLGSRSGNISSVLKVSESNIPAPIINTDEIPAASLFKTIGYPARSIHFLLPYLHPSFIDDFPFKESSKFTLMNGWHVKQKFNTNLRRGYNRVRLFCTQPYLSNVSKILITKGPENTRDKVDIYVSVNGMRISELTLDGDVISNININLDDACWLERNVIEIGIADKDENKGAIWSPYDPCKSFYVGVTFY